MGLVKGLRGHDVLRMKRLHPSQEPGDFEVDPGHPWK